MKVLINTPNINLPGGVANHYLGLKEKFTYNIYYNFIGGKSSSKLFLFYQLWDYLTFVYKLIFINPDIVHLNPSLTEKAVKRDAIYLIIARILDLKIIVFWHGWDKNYERMIENKYRKLFVKIFNKADASIVLANEFLNKLNKWGINHTIYLETTKVDDNLLREFNLEQKDYSKICILFLARIIKEKGIYESLETFKILKNRYRDIELIYAGDGEDLEELKSFTIKQKIKDVSFLGYLTGKEKINIFNKANIYFLPTYAEGMPTSLLEAMAFGLPIITRPVGGIKDFFEDGKMGFITESKEPSVYAELLAKLISNTEKCKEIGEYNYFYAKKNFYASIVAGRLEVIYNEIFFN